jgi:hypothetical protein
MADAMDSKSIDRKVMRVRLPPSAHKFGGRADKIHPSQSHASFLFEFEIVIPNPFTDSSPGEC